MWSAAVRLKPDTMYEQRPGPAEAGRYVRSRWTRKPRPCLSHLVKSARSTRTTLRPILGRSVTSFDHAWTARAVFRCDRQSV